MKNILIILLAVIATSVSAQKPQSTSDDSWKNNYRPTPEKINDLVNTSLEVSFDFAQSQMAGKARITLHPHFYPTDSLNLDAHNMNINEISVISDGKHIPLKYSYDSLNLRIKLDKTYTAGENYIVYIDYVAKPNGIKVSGGAAINDSKGLYFINPLGREKDKPTEVWTQGETESNSGWFPTIDKPNQKMTDDISITVPAKYVTLSNGLMIRQKVNKDGTRTDTWKMDLPHAPYLVMMAVGDYAVVKDSYKGKEVSYYVEKDYQPVARKIFGLTPEMIAFYSRITGVDFPWQKYSQVAVRDYVSGAMENTTATVHGEGVQQDARELTDGNSWEETIAHELFHMWFGDYITTESWSNLTVNESFATYGSMAWAEYKHGKDAMGEERFNDLNSYLFSMQANRDLVRFYYKNNDDMFDAVSYQKGACILYMLRNFVGDSAFYKSLNLFLTKNKFRAVEAQELRLAFEEVTGRDLNWFFNQWYYGSGHPRLEISYDYDQASGTAKVYVKQNQKDKVFRLPVAVDVYQSGIKKRYNVWVEHQADTFTFNCSSKPELINFDGDNMLLAEIKDHKSLGEYIAQYREAGLYLDRRKAIEAITKDYSTDSKGMEFIKTALGDKYFGLRLLTLQRLNLKNDSLKEAFGKTINDMAVKDPSSRVRAAAIEELGKTGQTHYEELFKSALNDSSYTVAGSALNALAQIDSAAAFKKARELAGTRTRGRLSNSVNTLLFKYSDEKDADMLLSKFENAGTQGKFNLIMPLSSFLKKVKNDDIFKKGIDMIVSFAESLPEAYRAQVRVYINNSVLKDILLSKEKEGLTTQAAYINEKLKPAK
ncbi:MAG TPA: M1 family metallopeptidase [Bacteroidales bacterium]|nr:M1 family metallopeptidase [Bacteroidales bacterium]